MKFRFEMSNSIEIEIEAKTKEEARLKLVDTKKDYAHLMVWDNCYISDGEEIKFKRNFK